MAKIALFDPYQGKFTDDMVNYWQIHGHEVQRQAYYNPEMVDWADVIWFDTADNNILSATNPDQALKDEWIYNNRVGKWDLHEVDLSNKKVIVRPIDIEVWSGAHAHENMWELVNDCIFIAPHIRDIMMADSRPQASDMNIHVIPHSVNLDRWTFRERKPGFKIAVVAEIWESKGIDYVLQIALKLKQIDPRYHIYYLGKDQQYHWHRFYMEEFIKNNKLNITFTDWVDNLDEWLDDKNYLLHSSIKEAFSAATAEALAKGIRVILHSFGGCDKLWTYNNDGSESGLVWNGIDEAIDMITDGKYDSQSYRQFLIDKEYTTDQMMRKIQRVIDA